MKGKLKLLMWYVKYRKYIIPAMIIIAAVIVYLIWF